MPIGRFGAKLWLTLLFIARVLVATASESMLSLRALEPNYDGPGLALETVPPYAQKLVC